MKGVREGLWEEQRKSLLVLFLLTDARAGMPGCAGARTGAAWTGLICLPVTINGCCVARKVREIADKGRLFARGEFDCALNAGCCCAAESR